MFKTAILLKISILLLIFFTLFVNIIYFAYPVNYLSYATGYGTETILKFVNLKFGDIVTINDHEKLCSSADLKFILKSYNNLETFAFLITKITAVAGLIYLFVFRKTLSKKTIFSVLFFIILSFIICFLAYSSDFDWSFMGCD